MSQRTRFSLEFRRKSAYPKKGTRFFARRGHILRQGIELKYQAIHAGRGDYPVRPMCCCLRVSHSGCYDSRKRQPSPNARLLNRIRTIHSDHDGVMGRRRMPEELGF